MSFNYSEAARNMDSSQIHSIKDLHVGKKIDWKIKVRVCKIWKEKLYHNGHVLGMNLIVVDKMLAKAFIPETTEDIEEIPIVVIASCRIHMRNGFPIITSVPATRFYVNPLHEANLETTVSFNYYTPINKLNPSKIKWNIRVRVQALWKGITRETKEFRGINLILVDDSKFRIHAFVNARFAVQFKNELEEGQIYNLSNFIVHEYSGVEFHRCVRFDKHIYFADYTKLQKSSNEGLKICKWSFDLFELLDLEKMQTDKRFLCDVVGVIEEVDPILEYVNDNKEAKKQKRFSITDGRCTVKITFFDQLAESFEEALKEQVDQKNIVIISSVKIGSFQGELNLTNIRQQDFT
ncbi:hypothetical protein POM88_023000 [Heracleum sosnowskyi]|uniref:Replication protein A1 n=1 Tax=Heracleum sosnowskyi TaxID=360622 RepID=A0AAD8IGE4_9APIA|nr:hypothetical protein POM88_023000 [Heracleum sosnowskyi]